MEENHQKIRVLIVDDNDVARRTMRGIIRQDRLLDYVGEATCGETAPTAIRTHSPDVVCLDVMMPRGDGLSVLESLAEESVVPRVLIITGTATADVVQRAKELGALGFIVKPFSAAKVLDAIRAAARR